MKQILLLLTAFILAGNVLSEGVTYKEGDVYLNNKRTSSVFLYKYQYDLINQSETYHEPLGLLGPSGFSQVESRDMYELEKGDRIILLESLRGGEIFKVALEMKKKKKEKNYYYFVETKSFKYLIFTEHLTE